MGYKKGRQNFYCWYDNAYLPFKGENEVTRAYRRISNFLPPMSIGYCRYLDRNIEIHACINSFVYEYKITHRRLMSGYIEECMQTNLCTTYASTSLSFPLCIPFVLKSFFHSLISFRRVNKNIPFPWALPIGFIIHTPENDLPKFKQDDDLYIRSFVRYYYSSIES